jgi:hypothetical protein
MSKINPAFIIFNALKRGYALLPNTPNMVYKIFGPEDLDEGDPGLYVTYMHPGESDEDRCWMHADITCDRVIKLAYQLSDEELALIAADTALGKMARKDKA